MVVDRVTDFMYVPLADAGLRRSKVSIIVFAFSRSLSAPTEALPVPWGRATAARSIWSACLGSTPRRTAMSTLSSNLATLVSGMILQASSREYRLLRSTLLEAWVYFFPWLGISFLSLVAAGRR